MADAAGLAVTRVVGAATALRRARAADGYRYCTMADKWEELDSALDDLAAAGCAAACHQVPAVKGSTDQTAAVELPPVDTVALARAEEIIGLTPAEADPRLMHLTEVLTRLECRALRDEIASLRRKVAALTEHNRRLWALETKRKPEV